MTLIYPYKYEITPGNFAIGVYMGALWTIIVGMGFIGYSQKPKETPRQEIKLESKLDAYSANLNNDNYPDLIIRRERGLSVYLGQEDGYKLFELTPEQKKLLKLN